MGLQKRRTALQLLRNDSGIALLTVLLVTALLIALIFEFAYATRISLNNAVNFRDSQRAYYIARSAISAFINPKYGDWIRQNVPQGMPFDMSSIFMTEDAKVLFRYDDEAGKIKITDVKSDPATQFMIKKLFENKNIDADVYNRMVDSTSDINKLSVLSGLLQYMSREDYDKVHQSLTISPVPSHTININAASSDVLQSLGIDSGAVALIVQQDRQNNPFTDLSKVPGITNIQINGLDLARYLTVKAGTIYSVWASVSFREGYSKEIDAVVNSTNIAYWRSL